MKVYNDTKLVKYKLTKPSGGKKDKKKRGRLKKLKITDLTPKNSLAIEEILSKDTNNKLEW
jgi:hypothetical protein